MKKYSDFPRYLLVLSLEGKHIDSVKNLNRKYLRFARTNFSDSEKKYPPFEVKRLFPKIHFQHTDEKYRLYMIYGHFVY